MVIIVLSPFIGAKQQIYGRKTVILVGYAAAVVGCGAFGLLARV